MALPTVTVTGKFLNPDGTAAAGSISFTLAVPMTDAADNVIVPAGTVTARLDHLGAFSVSLVPSNGAGLAPTPVAYTVRESFGPGRTYYITVPSTPSTSNLADLAPASAAPTPPTVYLVKTNNLSDLGSASTARTNLGLGTAATQPSSAFLTPAQGNAAYEALANKGVAGGYAPLDGTAKLPTANMPAGFAPLPSSLFIPASMFKLTQGTPTETNIGGIHGWAFAQSVDSRVTASVALDASWANIAVDVYWTVGVTATANVRWRYEEQFYTDGDTLSLASIVGVVDALPANAVVRKTTLTASRAITAGKRVAIGITRTGTNGADTFTTGGVMMTGVMLRSV